MEGVSRREDRWIGSLGGVPWRDSPEGGRLEGFLEGVLEESAGVFSLGSPLKGVPRMGPLDGALVRGYPGRAQRRGTHGGVPLKGVPRMWSTGGTPRERVPRRVTSVGGPL
jgi:hypothetical protein